MNIQKQVIAIGGGGFGRNPNSLIIEKYILNQSKKSKPNICFIPTASAEDKSYTVNYYTAFSKLDCSPTHINLFQRTPRLDSIINKQNIIYIGGGNTAYMLKVWKEQNLSRYFKKAYEKGIILSGVSAGAVCWFDWILTDSLGSVLQPIKGINLISGSCTPHSSDSKRINQFELNIKNNKLPPGIAIDDGVAVLFIDGKPSQVYSSRKNHDAYFIDKNKKISLKEYIKKNDYE